MNAFVLLVAMAATGVDVGWQPLDEGGFEYIIQIEPEMLESLLAGQAIQSDLPPFLQDVRTYRIVVGNEALPREDPEQGGFESGRVTEDSHAPAARDIADMPESAEEAAPRHETLEDGAFEGDARPTLGQAQENAADRAAPGDEVAEVDRAAQDEDNVQADMAGEVTGENSEPSLHAKKSIEPPRLPVKDRMREAPRTFVADGDSKPVVNQAGYRDRISTAEQRTDGTAAEAPGPTATTDGQAPILPDDATKPWWPLTLTLLGLFGSLGGNFYLGWVTWDIRGRYRRLVRDLKLKRPATELA